MSIELRSLDRSELAATVTLLRKACEYDAAAEVAEETLFGAAPGSPDTVVYGAFIGDRLAGVVATSARWLRVLAVRPEHRGRGIGTVLLAAAESVVASSGATHIRTLDQPGNYLAPGIDARNDELIEWLTRRDYVRCGSNTNLLIDVSGNDRTGADRAAALARKAADAGYDVRRATARDAPMISDQIGRRFSTGWAFETDRAMRFSPPGVHIAVRREDQSLAAFAVHDGNNQGLGWFGPAGTFEEHRRRGLGEALLIACTADVARAGHDVCTVAWIGPRDFYERAAGIAGERTYVVMRKKMTEP